MKESHEEQQAVPSFTLSAKDLTEILAKSNEHMAEVMAKAVVDAQKPYKSDAEKANEESTRQAFRLQAKRAMQAKKQDQAQCPHMVGCNALSDEMGTKTSIIWHRLDNGVVYGTCTNCQRQFWPWEKDYVFWFKKKSNNRMSAGGVRHISVMQAPPEQVEIPAQTVAAPTFE